MPLIRMLGHRHAAAAVEAVRVELEGRRDTAVVAVSDAYGELIALLRMDGAPVTAVQVAINKAYTAARMRRPSRAIGDAIRDPARGVAASFFGDPRIVGWAGGVPVSDDVAVIGAVGVSGMSQDLDEEMAGIGARAAQAAWEQSRDGEA
jgi:glc operon protein GlcG